METTKKSQEIQLTLKDLWRLEDCGVSDAFLTTYTDYKHCEKYKSTYLKPEFVKSDGRVHARFTNLVRTGRTSCNTPNIQQLPSRDAEFPLKLMYRAPEGAVLCATDFSFIELCAFGQALVGYASASLARRHQRPCSASCIEQESELLEHLNHPKMAWQSAAEPRVRQNASARKVHRLSLTGVPEQAFGKGKYSHLGRGE